MQRTKKQQQFSRTWNAFGATLSVAQAFKCKVYWETTTTNSFWTFRFVEETIKRFDFLYTLMVVVAISVAPHGWDAWRPSPARYTTYMCHILLQISRSISPHGIPKCNYTHKNATEHVRGQTVSIEWLLFTRVGGRINANYLLTLVVVYACKCRDWYCCVLPAMKMY